MEKYISNIFNSYFVEQLFVYCYEQLEQLRILIFGTIYYILTGKEIETNSLQSKLFLVFGTVTMFAFGMAIPETYFIKIIALLYKTAKQYKLLYMAYKEADEKSKLYKNYHPERTDDDIKNFRRRSMENHYRDLQEKEILVQVRELDESDVPEAIREQIKRKEAQM